MIWRKLTLREAWSYKTRMSNFPDETTCIPYIFMQDLPSLPRATE